MKKLNKIISIIAIVLVLVSVFSIPCYALTGKFDSWSYPESFGYIPLNANYFTNNSYVYLDSVNKSKANGSITLPNGNTATVFKDNYTVSSTANTWTISRSGANVFDSRNLMVTPSFFTDRDVEFCIPYAYYPNTGVVYYYPDIFGYSNVHLDYYAVLPKGVEPGGLYSLTVALDSRAQVANGSPYEEYTQEDVELASEYIVVEDVTSAYSESSVSKPSHFSYFNVYRIRFSLFDYIVNESPMFAWGSGITENEHEMSNISYFVKNLDVSLMPKITGQTASDYIVNGYTSYYNENYPSWANDLGLYNSLQNITLLISSGNSLCLSIGSGIDSLADTDLVYNDVARDMTEQSYEARTVLNLKDINLFSWLGSTLGGVLDVNIIGTQDFGISFADILGICVFIGLLMWFLKVMAGG